MDNNRLSSGDLNLLVEYKDILTTNWGLWEERGSGGAQLVLVVADLRCF